MALKQIAAGALTASDSTAKEEVGTIRVEANGKKYRYIRNCGSKTLAKGAAVNLILKSSNTYKVAASRPATEKVRGGPKNAPGGILVGSVRKGQYGWAQFKGIFAGTTLRTEQSGAHAIGARVGLACGQTAKVKVLSTCGYMQQFAPIGVVMGTGSETFMKGVMLYGI